MLGYLHVLQTRGFVTVIMMTLVTKKITVMHFIEHLLLPGPVVGTFYVSFLDKQVTVLVHLLDYETETSII